MNYYQEIVRLGTRGVVLVLMAGLIYLIARNSNQYNQKWLKWISLGLLTIGITYGTIMFTTVAVISALLALVILLMMIHQHFQVKSWVKIVFWISVIILVAHIGMMICELVGMPE